MYVLISLYHVEIIEGGAKWRMYGWRNSYDGDELHDIESRDEALRIAFSYGVPVMIGSGESIHIAAEKLAAQQ